MLVAGGVVNLSDATAVDGIGEINHAGFLGRPGRALRGAAAANEAKHTRAATTKLDLVVDIFSFRRISAKTSVNFSLAVNLAHLDRTSGCRQFEVQLQDRNIKSRVGASSDYTSGQQRAIALQAEVNEQSSLKHADRIAPKPIAQSTIPLTMNELKDGIGACCYSAGYRASDKGFLPMSVTSYLELLDWTARELRSDKRSATPASAAPLFERLGIDANTWCELTRDFGKLFSTVAGKPKVIASKRSRHRHQRYKIHNRAKELLTSQ